MWSQRPSGRLVLGFWGHIRCCGCCRWRFRSYSESPFSDAKKVTQKALPRRTARSLGLGVPSLRDRSGRSGSGRLRCTYTRCVRLRRTVAALPHPDRSRNEACRKGKRSKAKAKARSRAPHPSPLPREREPICVVFKTCIRLGIASRRVSPKHLGQFPLPLGEG